MTDPMQYALLKPAEMARADQAAIADGVPGRDLMAAAGEAVAHAIVDRWHPCRVLVVCGPGNNGGDGFVVARRLHERGWSVRVATLMSVDTLKGDAAWHAEQWHGELFNVSDRGVLEGVELVVDAVFGAGLSRDFDGPAAQVLTRAHEAGVPLCAIDTPSGVDGETGRICGTAIPAKLTVTFFRRKPGHVLMPGRSLCGEVVLADIGIPAHVLHSVSPQTFENAPGIWSDVFPWPSQSGHKYHRGHVLVSGGAVMTGAARLTALGAARAGAGLVTIACPANAWPVYAASMLSVMVEPLPDDRLESALADNRRNVVVVGPGAGVGALTRTNVLAAAATGRALVLDADALTAFADDAQALFRALSGSCVLTPHEGEFARLFGDAGSDKLSRARSAARQANAVVILKGPDTVVAAPDGRAVINANAPAWLATGGTGDVLAGVVAGLLAQGMPAFEAACAAVWLHGAAGMLAGAGLIAEDLPGMLPKVLQQLAP